MAMACVYTRAVCGIDAPLVTVEVHLSNGLPAFNLVGLPEASVKEAKERVRSAIINGGFDFPMRRITVNLAPAELPKQGGRYDLPIAIGILAASKQLPSAALENLEVIGELALSGQIRPCTGMLPVIIAAQRAQHRLIIPQANHAEAQIVNYSQVLLTDHLQQLASALHGHTQLLGFDELDTKADSDLQLTNNYLCLSEVIGQYQAKQALEIAAAGNHNLLLLGPHGTGKTMLANRILSILPPLSYEEALEVAAIHSVAGMALDNNHFYQRPFRAPHHTSSAISLIGGGSVPKPGEISLAHKGVLFLDELTEYPRKVLDCLREPMESGRVEISRAAAKVSFHSGFQLIGAMNPSPCGDAGEQSRATPEQIIRYLSRLSGPFLDRFDLSIDVPRLPAGTLTQKQHNSPTSEQIRAKVCAAREKQLHRAGVLNASLTAKQLQQTAQISPDDLVFLEQSVQQLGLSVRSFHKLQRIARTIADLDNQTHVKRQHIAQALSFRAMDRLLASLKNPY